MDDETDKKHDTYHSVAVGVHQLFQRSVFLYLKLNYCVILSENFEIDVFYFLKTANRNTKLITKQKKTHGKNGVNEQNKT